MPSKYEFVISHLLPSEKKPNYNSTNLDIIEPLQKLIISNIAHPKQVVVEPLVESLHGEEAVPAVEGGRRAVRVVLHADRVVEAHHDGWRAALARAVGGRADWRGPETSDYW